MIHSFAVTEVEDAAGVRVVTVVADADTARLIMIHVGELIRSGHAALDVSGKLPPAPADVLTVQQLEALERGSTVWAGGFHDDEQHKRTRWVKITDPHNGYAGRWMPEGGGGIVIGGRAGVSGAWLAGHRGLVELDRSEEPQTLDRAPDTT